jgi:diacylglycerol kinase (ATP)
MTTRLILNPKAGSAGKNDELIAAARGMGEVEVVRTEEAGDAQRLARRAAEEGCARVIAAGGDGTVNEVLNGLCGHLDRVTLGVLPLGTGNDLSRSLGLPDDPIDALPFALGPGSTRRIDILRVTHHGQSRVALNHINAGYGNLIAEQITAESKQRWGPFAYLATAASQLLEREEYHTRIHFDEAEVEIVDAVNIFAVNGRTVGGGFRIAPEASMEDGIFEVVIMRSGSLVDLAGMAAMTLVGKLADSEHVVARAVRSLRIESIPPMSFSVDGEAFCEQKIDVEILPRALQVLIGPEYIVDPGVQNPNRARGDDN